MFITEYVRSNLTPIEVDETGDSKILAPLSTATNISTDDHDTNNVGDYEEGEGDGGKVEGIWKGFPFVK